MEQETREERRAAEEVERKSFLESCKTMLQVSVYKLEEQKSSSDLLQHVKGIYTMFHKKPHTTLFVTDHLRNRYGNVMDIYCIIFFCFSKSGNKIISYYPRWASYKELKGFGCPKRHLYMHFNIYTHTYYSTVSITLSSLVLNWLTLALFTTSAGSLFQYEAILYVKKSPHWLVLNLLR